MAGSKLISHPRTRRVANHDCTVRSGRIEDGEDISDVLTEAMHLHALRRVAPSVAAMIEKQMTMGAQELGISGEFPHTVVASAPGVKQDRVSVP
jgi:hypothetical protein